MSSLCSLAVSNGDAKLPARKDSSQASSSDAMMMGRKFSQDSSLPINELPDCTSISKEEDNTKLPPMMDDDLKNDDDDTLASTGTRLLMEAIMIKTAGDAATRDRLDSTHTFVSQRQRLESWGGMSELSFSGTAAAAALEADANDMMIPTRIHARDRLDSCTSTDDTNGMMQQKIQAYVAAAMESVSDELGDLAGIVEHVASVAPMDATDDFFDSKVEVTETISRPRSQSVSSVSKFVDLNAVQAAVDAGEAASQTTLKELPEYQKPVFAKRTLPLARDRAASQASGDSKGSIPLKKRAKRPSVVRSTKDDEFKTPKISNTGKRKRGPTPDAAPSSGSNHAKGDDRWEAMYTELLQFAASKRHEATKDMSDVQANAYVWDGNVPTSFITKEGHKLGRWVNNQRTAKQKNKLRPDREEKLITAGLKWFVIPPDAWDDMFEELKLYIATKQKDGEVWDGHVPTNYQITGRTWKSIGTDKNLGRWVNRQRDLFQSGKLKPARKEKLEKLGLKWPKNAVTWDEMFQHFQEYGAQQRQAHGTWDGTVPESYQTDNEPPRLLGKWVYRQKVNRIKKKLTKVQEDKLTNAGMVWGDNDHTDDKPPAVPNVADCEPVEVVSIPLQAVSDHDL